MSWRRFLRRELPLIEKLPELVKARKPGIFQIGEIAKGIGGVFRYPAVKYPATIGALGYALGFARREIGIRTPAEEMKEEAEAERMMIENAEKELKLYKDYLNTIRSAIQPGYWPYRFQVPPMPEWLIPGTKKPHSADSGTDSGKSKGLDWSLAIPAVGILLIVGALILGGKGK